MSERVLRKFKINGKKRYYFMDEENETIEEVIKYLEMKDAQEKEKERLDKLDEIILGPSKDIPDIFYS